LVIISDIAKRDFPANFGKTVSYRSGSENMTSPAGGRKPPFLCLHHNRVKSTAFQRRHFQKTKTILNEKAVVVTRCSVACSVAPESVVKINFKYLEII